ncbi:MAG: hypothetical protein O3C34_05890 [Proteobacteria bacterium]|nr:hypothetical protein [Pseudomonadota bacterium]
MKFAKTLIIAALPLAFAVGCETPATDASMTQGQAGQSEMANKEALMAAENAAKRAADSANEAAAAAASAARAAEAAAAEAKASGDKADRVFRKGMRK